MSIDVVSPLRQRMIEDMAARKLSAARRGSTSAAAGGSPRFSDAHPRLPPSRTSAASNCTSPRQGRASPTATVS